MACQNELWRRAFIIELHEEGGDDLFRRRVAFVLWIESLGAPVLARPVEEDLHTGLATIHGEGEHIGLFHAFRVDILRGTHSGNGADTISQACGLFEFEVFCRFFHICGQLFMQADHLAAQEVCRLIGQRLIVFLRNQVDAGRGAALDLVQHAGAGALLEHGVLAGAQEEGFLQRVQRAGNRACAGERAEIVALMLFRAAIFQDLRGRVVAPDEDVRKALIVAQKDVEAGL